MLSALAVVQVLFARPLLRSSVASIVGKPARESRRGADHPVDMLLDRDRYVRQQPTGMPGP